MNKVDCVSEMGIVDAIEYFHKEFKIMDDFKPKEKTNRIFTELVKYCIDNDLDIPSDKEVLEKVKFINKCCAYWEYELEKYYANKIIHSKDPKKELEKFNYYENYEDLIKLEFKSISIYLNKIKKALFVWWWPLSLSAIVLAKNYWIKSVVIDYDNEAVSLSKKVIEKVGLDDYIEVKKWNIENYVDNEEYSLCHISSFVFWATENKKVIENLSKINFNLLLTRTSDKTRQLLYKKTNESILKKYFDIKFIAHPKNYVVNSIILSSKK